MSMAFSRPCPHVAFKRVASIVIFTYVAADIVSKEELTSWMLTYKFIYVKYEVIQKYIFLSIIDAAVKLFPGHGCVV